MLQQRHSQYLLHAGSLLHHLHHVLPLYAILKLETRRQLVQLVKVHALHRLHKVIIQRIGYPRVKRSAEEMLLEPPSLRELFASFRNLLFEEIQCGLEVFCERRQNEV